MRLSDFDFELPERLIALRPASPRDSARLLVVRGTALEDRVVRDLPGLLRPGDVLVVNDTRVLPARLHGVRHRAAGGVGASPVPVAVEILLDRRVTPSAWTVLARPAKRLKPGDRIAFGTGLSATVERHDDAPGGTVRLAFDRSGASLDDAVVACGAIPLPPYVAGRREADARDVLDYQTTFAAHPGAVAAPTAGLHFTDALLGALAARDVTVERLTLHVGAGTFLPVRTEEVAEHVMHPEWGRLDPGLAERLNAARGQRRRVVAVGTTSLRLLETACGADGRFSAFEGDTAIFIVPGRPVRGADVLMTNFHLPRSTLFMLVCAFAGTDAMKAAYAHAIASGYRFYSYGDATLLHRGSP